MSKNILLLSIHDEFAKKIFNGTKNVELRRIRPRINHGDLVLVYVPTPIKALLGAFRVDKVVEATPLSLWKEVKNKAGISRKHFDDYFNGASKGFGIFFQETWSLPEPLELANLRNLWPNFHPPQGYRYMNLDDLNIVGL